MDKLKDNPIIITAAMECMHQRSIEKELISIERTFKSLMVKLFTSKKEKQEEIPKFLQRGLIVTLDDTTNTGYFVYDVFKNKYKKWHMPLLYDNPAWPTIEKEAEK